MRSECGSGGVGAGVGRRSRCPAAPRPRLAGSPPTRRVVQILALVALLAARATPAEAICTNPPGDLNGDGVVVVVDVQCAVLASLWNLAGQATPPPACIANGEWIRADLNCDGSPDVVDVLLDVNYALKMDLPPDVDANADGCPDTCQVDTDGDGTIDWLDCVWWNPSIHPGAVETCNGWDDDCDGLIDEDLAAEGTQCSNGDLCDGVEVCSAIAATAPRIDEIRWDHGDGIAWVELFNPTPDTLDVHGWTLSVSGGGTWAIPGPGPAWLPAGGYLVVGNTAAASNLSSLIGKVVDGLAIDAVAGDLTLADTQGNVVDVAHFDPAWLAGQPDASLARTDPDADGTTAAAWAPSSWAITETMQGTPGSPNFDVSTFAGCVVAVPPPDCTVNAPCLEGVCHPTDGCLTKPANKACDDGNPCTENDYCVNGVCSGTPAACDDGNVCTTDACDPGSGCTHTPVDGPCDDGDACTLNDTCSGGVCTSQVTLDCNDSNPCTSDVCDAFQGCLHPPASGPCDDGDACTTNDSCSAGQCVGGAPVDCDDGESCTLDQCSPLGGCHHTPLGLPCDDGNACTVNDVCQNGTCTGGGALNCDDGNACTVDSCDSASGCVHTPSTGACDDGDACTTGDACHAGQCTASGVLDCDDGNPCTVDQCVSSSGCSHAPVSLPCDDGDACTTNDTCSGGQCTGGAALDCDDGNVCTTDGCDPASGGCTHAPAAGPCDDGNACTANDACSGGQCGGEAISCDDGNPCTADSCNPLVGCLQTYVAVPCDDGNPCTVGDVCSSGSCVGSGAANCQDGNPCTDDGCDPAIGCTHIPNASPCEDGSLCTVSDTCLQGTCNPGVPANCDDANPCTDDGCDPTTGCTHTPNTEPCDDGDVCTDGDTCAGGSCQPGTQLGCGDGNPCTDDHCDPTQGCTYTFANNPCSDGNECTGGDYCLNGFCFGGAPIPCTDDSPCTDDTCHPAAGCLHTPIAAPCNDGSACTTDDHCVNGACTGGTAISCDDGNPCTADSCDAATGCKHVASATPCDDGNACTTGDTCFNGSCTGGPPVDCNDGNACTDDACNPLTGCTHTSNNTPCSDGNKCTTDDHCAGGQCVGGGTLQCDDGNACTADSCDPASGCQHVAKDGACNDGDDCTVGDICHNGQCTGGPQANCDDGNPCTDDSCLPSVGCVNLPNFLPCNDGNACTDGDICYQGNCLGGPPLFCDDGNPCTDDSCHIAVGCIFVPNNQPCDDGDKCTNGDSCRLGSCSPGVALDCDDGNVCTDDSCDSTKGCQHTPNALPCEDGSACTVGDTCAAGFCLSGMLVTCNDNNFCTNDLCDPQKGCQYTPNDWPCDDGNACTSNDHCYGGVCVGVPAFNCDDNNPCTIDSCDFGTGCTHSNFPGACDDGNACTLDDRCNNGQCEGGAPVTCDDANPCTTDTCDPATGCVFSPNNLPCDDGNACTVQDTCAGGACVGGVPASCDDGNPCTDDTCDSSGGCAHANNAAACDDGNACTANDVCSGGTCQGGPAPDCNDGNPCTNNWCDVSLGCQSAPNSAPCNDGNACTVGDACANGACISGAPANCDDGNACTTDTCDPGYGCQYATNTGPCDDGNACTQNDTCSNGTCHAGAAVVCDDGNPCTDDFCNPLSGCSAAPNTAPCDDGNACTTADSCAAGACKGGPAPNCDDGNGCTDDVCDPAVGCVHANNAAACDDGDSCTAGDHCQGGACHAGPPLDCDDGNPCTDDFCNQSLGCQNLPNAQPCDDGNPCTVGDACGGGACIAGGAASCEDGNPCTSDQCDPAQGCLHAPQTGPCTDGNPCTLDETCVNGTCKPQTVLDCNDSNPCTDDTCDAANGCSHTPNTAPCDDANACTSNDHCVGGVCAGGPTIDCDDGNGCTNDACDPTTGCTHTPNNFPCDDGDACTANDACAGGSCQAGSAIVCDDGNPCTSDQCDPVAGCVFPNSDGTPCDDGNTCTTNDHCVQGVCVGSGGIDCNDNNPCTDDVCTAGQGCQHIPNAKPCDDGDPCTTGDVCSSGTCVGKGVAQCDDANPCTDDTCVQGQGCVHTPNSLAVPCYDGPPGTEGVGICHAGQRTCSNGQLGPCLGQVTPQQEVCDGKDNDCNQLVDEQDASGCTTYYVDNDGDGWGVGPNGQCLCAPKAPFLSTKVGDCNDARTNVNPGETEVCDGMDNNCDGNTDEGSATALCGSLPHANLACVGGKCVTQGCAPGWYDIDGISSNGCECKPNANPNAGLSCDVAFSLGTFADDGSSTTVQGSVVTPDGSEWYVIDAPDGPDPNSCDTYHVRVRFLWNPGNAYVLDVFQGACDAASALCSGGTEFDWYTNFFQAGATPVDNRGECPCVPPGDPTANSPTSDGVQVCTDNSSSYFIRVYRAPGAAAACDGYTLEITNGVY